MTQVEVKFNINGNIYTDNIEITHSFSYYILGKRNEELLNEIKEIISNLYSNLGYFFYFEIINVNIPTTFIPIIPEKSKEKVKSVLEVKNIDKVDIQNNFVWDDNTVIDFVNWYIGLHKLGFRYTLENMTIIESFKNGDSFEEWYKK